MASARDPIEVEVELVGAVRRPWPEQSRKIQLPAGSTAADLLTALGYDTNESKYLVIHVNGTKSRRADVLAAGDHVTLMLIIGGG